MKWSGYAGKVLEVDLTSGAITTTELDRNMAELYVGGKGFGARILYDRLPAGCDPLSPDNIIVLATGPLTGTSVAASGRLELCTKGPATNLWLDCNAGGSFGPELKYAGYDVLIVTGAAAEPVMLVIEDENVRLVAANEYWGLDTLETSQRLKADFSNDHRVTCIGQAGELLSPLASVQTEYRSFGRGGAGAVMGSKKLKAVVVCGSGGLRAAETQKLDMMIREAANELANSPDTGSARPEFGTNVLLSLMEYTGIHPNKNFQQSTLEGEPVNELQVSKYFERSRACFACPIRCSKIARVKEGRFKGAFTEGPEYETVWAFGGHCANKDIPTIIEAEHVCDAYGLDAVSVGNVIGFLMDCWERGLITAADTAGLEFTWGNVEAMIEAVHLMGKREGPGMDWSMGVRHLEEIIPGAAGLGGHVKGLELPAYDPRASKAMALAYATSDRGGCHLRSWPISEEVMVQNPLGQHTLEFKPEVVKGQQDFYSLINSSGLCLFAAFVLTMEQIAPLIEYATGLPGLNSADKLIAAGERINTLVRLFNLREGLTAAQDTIPDRFRTDPLPDGPCKGETVDVAQLVSAYYCLREWDSEGRPTEELLNKLGLAERSAAPQQ
ncbi:aldehyde ferredoxin oxidoreductase family protein [Desulfovibrio sp. Fe33]|uniref:aldehyde ferredoxin oxidoreductase family protein n=1 Tax=Desulfovibrio sp. Fe33 TaxID=3020842 RepID=UPI00234C0D65|nr:aldehyde ferredoxin oxidoreductase family protein [Desulfovibrio sp. Fe33]